MEIESKYRVFYLLACAPLKLQSMKEIILAGLDVSGTIYINLNSPNKYIFFLGGAQAKR